jgi:2-methylcitrate dehydratase
MSTISQDIAKFVADFSYEKLPEEIVTEAKRFLYDSIGCAFGGFQTQDVKIAKDVYLGMGGIEEATILGFGKRCPAPNATLLNSMMIRALDFNDIYWKQDPAHPSDLIPAALSLGERKKASGKDVILAIVLGYEFLMRLSEVADPGVRERKWHHATLTQFASAIIAGKILGLNAKQIANAIGISGSHNHTIGAVASGKLTMMKNAADPFAVQSGVMAALLAEKGFEGPEHVFEGKEGLAEAHGGKWNLDILTENLGETFRIKQCSMKAYPVEGLAHSTLSAAIKIAGELDLWPEEVKSVEIETISRAVDILADPAKFKPTTRETADHSLPFCVASAILDKNLTPASFADEQLNNERIMKLIDKITITANPEFDKLFPEMQPSKVTINAMDGRTKTQREDYPKGDPWSPMTQEDLDTKFKSLTSGSVSVELQTQIRRAIFDCEKLPDISNLMALCIADMSVSRKPQAQKKAEPQVSTAAK